MRKGHSSLMQPITLSLSLALMLTVVPAGAQIIVDGSPDKDWADSAMKLWLRADAGITQTSGSVTSWADQSNSGYTASLALGANSPTLNSTLVNGTAGIAFDGNDYLLLSGSLTSYRTLFIVYQDTSTAAYVTPVGSIYATPQTGGSYHGAVNDATLFVDGNTNIATRNGAIISNGTATTSAIGRPDAWSLNTYMATATLTNRVTTIGADNSTAASRAINGGIAEILLYDRALTSPELNAVEPTSAPNIRSRRPTAWIGPGQAATAAPGQTRPTGRAQPCRRSSRSPLSVAMSVPGAGRSRSAFRPLLAGLCSQIPTPRRPAASRSPGLRSPWARSQTRGCLRCT